MRAGASAASAGERQVGEHESADGEQHECDVSRVCGQGVPATAPLPLRDASSLAAGEHRGGRWRRRDREAPVFLVHDTRRSGVGWRRVDVSAHRLGRRGSSSRHSSPPRRFGHGGVRRDGGLRLLRRRRCAGDGPRQVLGRLARRVEHLRRTRPTPALDPARNLGRRVGGPRRVVGRGGRTTVGGRGARGRFRTAGTSVGGRSVNGRSTGAAAAGAASGAAGSGAGASARGGASSAAWA